MNVSWRSLMLAIALLTAGCGSPATPGQPSATASSSAQASASGSQPQRPTTCGQATPSTQLAVLGPSGPAPVADTKVYLRDQPSKPVELCAVPHAPGAKFVSPTMISFVQIPNFTPSTSFTEYDSHVVLHDSKDGSNRTVITATGNIWDFDWSPDGRTVVYGLQSRDGFQLWVKQQGAAQRPLTGMLVLAPRGFFPGDGNGIWVRFSPSGSYLVMANTLVRANHMQVFRTSDWSLLWSTGKGGSPLWSRSGDRLYFEDFAGEHVWEPSATVTTVVPDGWLDPTLSPDGCCVAYTVDYGTSPHVEVRNLQSGTREQLEGMHAAYPIFASLDNLGCRDGEDRLGRRLPSVHPERGGPSL
jgi:hypothetical protein